MALLVGVIPRLIEKDSSIRYPHTVTVLYRYIDVLQGSKMICCYQQQAAQGQHNKQRDKPFITTSHAILQLLSANYDDDLRHQQ
jgi:hypothetical protein